ncbi:hypothetical protein H2200_005476 [Cladophialophora chaetospira]|uniref:Rhodopsin domain-containing protein n=1 Tax=Cladophialophora chaetospira TaxID=386627 RepID=A0AA38XCR1_9EURO|nr:hypothetical protein H2200_005476 [Cladophialophora chaetospira]
MGADRGMQAVVTATIFTALAGLFVILRCISRFWVIHQPGPEDYFIIFAMVLSVATTITIALEKDNGLGRHQDTVSQKEGETMLKVLYASIIVYNLGLFLVKDSILYQYLRFFVERRYRRAAWFLIGFILVGGVAFILTGCFACSPIAFSWDKSIQGGHCINQEPLWFSFSGFNILTDLAVWVLPMPVLWKLQLPRKQKLSLIGVFALGGFGCITGMLRLHAIYVATNSTDPSYDNLPAATWSAAELNVGIMCACVPALRPVISLVFPRLLSTTRRDHSTNPTRGPYARRSTQPQNESVVELSHGIKAQSEISRDDTVSLEHSHDPNSIRVKNECVYELSSDLYDKVLGNLPGWTAEVKPLVESGQLSLKLRCEFSNGLRGPGFKIATAAVEGVLLWDESGMVVTEVISMKERPRGFKLIDNHNHTDAIGGGRSGKRRNKKRRDLDDDDWDI